MSHWAVAPIDRTQITLFAPTLDDSLADGHPVRLFDELLRAIDFKDWESMYIRVVGQPPIHPRVMAAGYLYGLSLGIRSSRKLEDACGNRLDFIWLMEGRKPDHATFCNFRTQFGPQLKTLFHKVGRVGIGMGLITLNQFTLDGTDTRANNSRYNTARRATLEQKLAVLDAQIDLAMKQAEEQDKFDNELYGPETSPVKLPRELRDLKRRQEKLKEALKRESELQEARSGRKDLSAKGPAVPLADPASRVLPNKGGGHAPNYTSVLATDSDSDMILDPQVIGSNDEASTVLSAVANIEEAFGVRPKQLAADSNFNSGPNLAGLEQLGVEALMPARQEFRENPAIAPDAGQTQTAPTQTNPIQIGEITSNQPSTASVESSPATPCNGVDGSQRGRVVPLEQWGKLPINPQGKILDKAAFIYDSKKDCYTCPMGQELSYSHDKPYKRDDLKGTYRIYQCAGCGGCPLASRCLPKNATERRVCRDEYEELREQMARRMNSEQGRAQYKRRSHAAETPFAVLKTQMNFRQFLLRGLDKVQMELRWVCAAYNLRKLVKFKAAAAAAALAALKMPSVTPAT